MARADHYIPLLIFNLSILPIKTLSTYQHVCARRASDLLKFEDKSHKIHDPGLDDEITTTTTRYIYNVNTNKFAGTQLLERLYIPGNIDDDPVRKTVWLATISCLISPFNVSISWLTLSISPAAKNHKIIWKCEIALSKERLNVAIWNLPSLV